MKNILFVCAVLAMLSSCGGNKNSSDLLAFHKKVYKKARSTNDHYSAIYAAQAVLTADSTQFDYKDSLLMLYSITENHEATYQLSRELLGSHDSNEFLQTVAMASAMTGHYDEAITNYKVILSRGVTNPTPINYRIATYYLKQQNNDSAMVYLTYVVQDPDNANDPVEVSGTQVPTYAATLNAIGYIEIQNENYRDAIFAFETALKTAPHFQLAYNNMLQARALAAKK